MWNTTDSKVSLDEPETVETSALLAHHRTSTAARNGSSRMGNEAEAGHGKGEDVPPSYDATNGGRRDSVAAGIDDVAIIPKGVLDPVYEAKARVINRAVSLPSSSALSPRCAPLTPH